MRYAKADEYKLELIFEGEDITDVLRTIAEHSFETASPRMHTRYFPIGCVHNFDSNVIKKNGAAVMLLMDYIHGRDCRTKVYLGNDNKWYFDSYAFSQRKVTSEEFVAGVRREYADKFLDEVIEKLSEGKTAAAGASKNNELN